MGYDSTAVTGFNRQGYLGDFASPWRTMSSSAMPTQNTDALKLCEFAWNAESSYRTAQERLSSYFLTDIDVTSLDRDNPVGEDETEKWKAMLEETFNVRDLNYQVNIDVACYGNAFVSAVVPFKRFLVSTADPKRTQYDFERVAQSKDFDLRYDMGKNEFTAICPQAKTRCKFDVFDLPGDIERKLSFKTWSPHEIEIIFDPWSLDTAYVWKIPDYYRRSLQNQDWHQLARAPKQVLEAVSQNKWFRFAPDAILHLKEHHVSGLRMQGWGLSRVLLNYRDMFHLQVLRCYNEAIAMDYVIPLRLVTPETAAGQVEATGGLTNLGDARAQLERMIRQRRRDPFAWHTLPFPVKYQLLGGDAKDLVPHEMLEFATDVLLNGAGTPPEMYRGSLQLAAAPVALRLFESNNVRIVRNNNMLLTWVVRQISQLTGLPLVKAVYKRVTHADDFNKQMAALQLFMGRQMSGGTAFSALGLDWKNEQRTIAEETAYQQRLQADMQQEMEQTAYGEAIAKGQAPGQPGPAGAGGAPPAAGAPPPAGQTGAPPPGGGLSAIGDLGPEPSLPEVLSQAEAATSALLELPTSQRIGELRALKQKSPLVHSIVKAQLEEQRSAARSAGQQQLQQAG